MSVNPLTVTDWLKAAIIALEPVSPTPVVDAELLIIKALNCSRASLKAWPDKVISQEQLGILEDLLGQRKNGVPIAYLLGTQPFWDIELQVNPDVLIPRPETELLVELALDYGKNQQPSRILDLGTGSGAIAISYAKSKPQDQVDAVDFSKAALGVAEKNAILNKVTNVNFIHSNWFASCPINAQYQLILSNPPYIDPDDKHVAQGDLRFEPITALVAKEKGYQDLRIIIDSAKNWLLPGGAIMLEHGFQQGEGVRKLLSEAGYYKIKTYRDHLQHERVTTGMVKE